MNFAGDFAVLQWGNQRHANRLSNFVPCAEWVGGRERKRLTGLDYFDRPIGSVDGQVPVVRGGLAPNS